MNNANDATDLQSAAQVVLEAVGVEVQADLTTGYAAIQNNVPVLRALTITNNLSTTLSNIVVLVGCSPAFATGARLHFSMLVAGESRKIPLIDLQPDHGYMSQLDESERATINITVRANDEVLASKTHEIEVLAYDQWAGARSLPELLAAFCMPNSVVVDQIISRASVLLHKKSAELSMCGYQAKHRERVWEQVSAIYSTLMAEDLQYSNPPASFGNDGQKIRTPERIIEGKVGTCLDLAMLLASCFEQAGLHAVVLFKEGHAWVGVWLIETNFPTAVVDDVQAIRKRVKSGELLVLEATGLASGQKPKLRWACTTGQAHLDEEGSFRYAIDIRRARELQIRALPSKAKLNQNAVEIDAPSAPALEDMPNLPPLDPESLPPTEVGDDETPEGRLARWKSKLLDLTLRNRLLNFKPTKSNMRVICPDLGALEDVLADGKEFRIRPAPQIMEGYDPREGNVFTAKTAQQPLDALAKDALKHNEIIVNLSEQALEGNLLEIYRAAETGLEEGGANTLFLVFGMLEWREAKDSELKHLAPIILIPVTLSRQSVKSGFRLTRHDDDALINPTLIQKLTQDFALSHPSLVDLPTDDSGLDIDRILQNFRLQVGEIKGWEVREEVHLGIFSFTKYLMWKDLQDRQKQLMENPVVAHLVNNPGQAMQNGEFDVDIERLDETHKPQDLFAPLLSDSSQLRAICVASAGSNLVIEGPPGTGKSQTITNLISHLLTTGKTVLFVSEKMAALEVVHRRLNALGLGPFCLELHSSKAKKSDVVKQLGNALEAASSRTVKDWEMEAQRLAGLRQELNALVQTLHREHANDLNIYDAMGICIKHHQKTPAAMEWSDPNIHSRQDLEVLREISRQMGALASQLTDIATHPLSAITKGEWSPSWQQDLLNASQALARSAEQVQAAAGPLLKLFGFPDNGMSLVNLTALDLLADILVRAPKVPTGIARAAHDESVRARVRNLTQHGLERSNEWDSLNGMYREEFAQLPAAELKMQWAEAQSAWWPKKWFAKRAVANRLKLFRTDSKRPSEHEILRHLVTLARINAEDKIIEAMGAEATILLQEEYHTHHTDWNAVASYERWAQDFSSAVSRMAGTDLKLLQTLQGKLQAYVAENRAVLNPDGALGSILIQYRDLHRTFVGDLHHVGELGACDATLVPEPGAAGGISRLLGILQNWQIASRQLQPWCLWQNIRSKAIAHGLKGIVNALEVGDVPLADIEEFFEYSYQNWWVRKAIDREPILCAFSSADHDRKIAEFRKADERFQKLTEQYTVARLSGQIPAATHIPPGAESEMGRLRKELQRQRGHMAIRKLVQSLPTLLPKLKPCLLMSPLSVAQYLDADHCQFDVVMFDEASQITVWDAVGAIARGRQLVCVGDPKQLPPTNFFNRSDDGDEFAADDDLQDMESILDECMSIGMPKLSLDWHYRSRHESLITFSNVTYYDNRLVTFPSPVTEDRAVRLERVHGVYDRGGSRTNRAEAEAIVSAIEAHFLDPEKRKFSLGVVTFNRPQQDLIERLLDARRRTSNALDQAIAQISLEPLFIKNLENVQGDERDVIYFSITYGPDVAGKVSLNFGPLNLEGGHRRLNVAVSRARQSAVIFSTLMPDQIDLSKVRAAGVRDLKNYLEFAIRGARAIAEQTIPTGMEPDSPFEREVISALRNKGWDVHPQVGVSGYRIDIGVVDPRSPGRYLLGVECDGRTYHSGATARDRDRLRQYVLEGLGWKLHRIWSTDWWLNPQEPMRKLIEKLEAMLNEDAVTVEEDVEPSAAVEIVNELASDPDEPAYAELVSPAAEVIPSQLAEYRVLIPKGGKPEKFYDMSSRTELSRQLLDVINAEGPVEALILYKRLATAWGLGRLGSRIIGVLQAQVSSSIKKTKEGDKTFYWPQDVDPKQWESFRAAGASAESKRNVDEVCLEELGNLALFILDSHGSTSFEDLARSICRMLGIARTTNDAELRIRKALVHGRLAALVAENNGKVMAID